MLRCNFIVRECQLIGEVWSVDTRAYLFQMRRHGVWFLAAALLMLASPTEMTGRKLTFRQTYFL